MKISQCYFKYEGKQKDFQKMYGLIRGLPHLHLGTSNPVYRGISKTFELSTLIESSMGHEGLFVTVSPIEYPIDTIEIRELSEKELREFSPYSSEEELKEFSPYSLTLREHNLQFNYRQHYSVGPNKEGKKPPITKLVLELNPNENLMNRVFKPLVEERNDFLDRINGKRRKKLIKWLKSSGMRFSMF